MKYRNKLTGAEFISSCKCTGENWEVVNDFPMNKPEPESAKEQDEPKEAPKSKRSKK